MKAFFRNLLASFLGSIIAGIIVILIVFGIIGSLLSKEKVHFVDENSVLYLKLNQPIVERVSQNPLDDFNIQGMNVESKMGLNDILRILEKAGKDENIRGIFLHIPGFSAGVATIEEIRNALIDFKKTGKFIIAYSDFYSQGDYYLASVADKIYLNPQGLVEFKGLSANVMFVKKALEKLELNPIIIRGTGNQFKSAVEPLMNEKMSEANREQTKVYINSIWNHFLKGISEYRSIPVDELNRFANEMIIRNPQACLDNGLIDGLKFYDEILQELETLVEVEEDEELEMVSFNKYKKASKKYKFAVSHIAIIYANGSINMGKGDFESIGSESLSRQIRRARKDNRIKAIILRVNSPGGSALASEVIWREMELARQEKPVIVSMGDVAASGGYYIACNADTIIANHTTLTGSIGVFGVLMNVETFMENTLGITTDTVNTNPHADIGSLYRAMTDEERAVIQEEVDRIYSEFIKHVADGRDMTTEMVDSIGQGRVWSGINAMEIELIDVFGGLKDAVRIAEELSGLRHYTIKEFPVQKDPFKEFLNNFGNVKVEIITPEISKAAKIIKKIEEFSKMKGIQARLLFEIEVK